MNDKNEQKEINVHIFGKSFSVKSDEGMDYTEKIAKYLSDEMKAIAKHIGNESFETIAIFAALNITDRYFKEKEKSKFIEEKIGHLLNSTKIKQ